MGGGEVSEETGWCGEAGRLMDFRTAGSHATTCTWTPVIGTGTPGAGVDPGCRSAPSLNL